MSTAILDGNNPLSVARSYFIGNQEDAKKSITKCNRKVIDIETLKKRLDGSYKKISSTFPGSKISKIETTVHDLKNELEETHPEGQAVLKEMMKNVVRGDILFYYKKKSYSFSITKTGGLLFQENVPEEVLTYILYNIVLSDNGFNGS